jgi:2-alkyl-3-oxoalkanoate reductase
LKIGVVGAGVISGIHLTAASSYPGGELVGIADRDIARARAQAERFSIKHSFDNVADLLALKPDVVHVLTPPGSHESVTLEALQAGAHVYVEKPMATSVASCERMAHAAAAANRQLCVGHCWVYNPAMTRARRLLESGEAGAVLQAASSWNFDISRAPTFGKDHWSTEMPGGLAEDVVVHPLSVLIHLLGASRRTFAVKRSGTTANGGPEDMRALLDCEHGLGTLSVSFRARPDLALADIWCERMLLRLNLSSMTLTIHRDLPMPRKIARGVSNLDIAGQLVAGTAGTVWKLIRRKVDGSYGIVPLIHAFYAALESERPAPVGPAEGIQSLAVLRSIWPVAETTAGAGGIR